MRFARLAVATLASTAALVGTGTAAKADTPAPVVFVNGFMGSGANWTTARTVFQNAGYPADRLFAYEYNSYGDNKQNAQGLDTFVQQVKSQTGADKVDIVNHSMGGLVSLWYLKVLNGSPNVAHLASLAGANHGTTAAYACFWLETCRQMFPGSPFIQQITAGDETPGNTAYATWYSSCDGVINPYKSTMLTGATNNEVACEKHMDYLTDTKVLGQVATFLRS
ncbi:esterase/lipase family protein [Actinomadura rupiterrae]|uniref:esterase/lipase family protein n=1 Tax=Actinomadura rupiterrae TaxID=559627 RepID=UPI0020A462D0|nr:alpha/beta fold hydrolase [Actinomadura rupiterrae]MCP2338981.1 triacylglycerol lipase [Actinomadura rupiterrae]